MESQVDPKDPRQSKSNTGPSPEGVEPMNNRRNIKKSGDNEDITD